MIRRSFILPLLILILLVAVSVAPRAYAACDSGEVQDPNTGLCFPASSAQGIQATIDQETAQNSQQLQQQSEAQTQTELNNLNTTGSVTGNAADATPASSGLTSLSTTPPANNTANAAGAGLNGDPTAAFGWLLGGLMLFFAWLAGAAGVLLNDAVYYTVLQMGSYVNNLNAVGVSWRILRDIGNIVLIFGFVAIGISTIVGYDSYGVSKRLPTLLIVAVLLNFSLLISEAIIDTGNLFAAQFYTEINGGQQATVTSISLAKGSNNGISNAIMNSIGLQTLYNVSGTGGGTSASSGNILPQSGTVMIIGFLGIILFIVASFVMLSLALILVARFVALIFLIVVAPIGFAGLLIPKLEGTAREWWSTLFNQALTAPVLLLMLYVALAVITDSHFLTGLNATTSGGGYAAALASTGSGTGSNLAGLLLSFVVAMGLLLMCTLLAKRMSAFGAGAATSIASKLSGASLATAVPGWALRGTAGALSYRASEGLKGTAIGRSFIGRGLTGQLDKVGKASFDLRNTDAAKALTKETGLGLGQAQKGGYKQDLEDKRKYYEDTFGRIKGRKKTEEEEKSEEDAKNAVAAAELAHGVTAAGQGAAKQDYEQKKIELTAKEAALDAARAELTQARNDREAYQNLSGGKTTPELEGRIQQAQAKIKNAEEDRTVAKDTTDRSRRALDDMDRQLKQSDKIVNDTRNAQIKLADALKTATSPEAAQKAYADRIKKGFAGTSFPQWMVPGQYGVSKAAESISKNAGKSKDLVEVEKMLKKITENTKKAADEGGKAEEH